MIEYNELTFVAIITITLPGSDKPTQLKVTMTPFDPVGVEDGNIKPLQECTLAELQQFAERVESDIWAKYASATLVDLVVEGDTEITFDLPEGSEYTPEGELWLENAIVLPEAKKDDAASDEQVMAEVKQSADSEGEPGPDDKEMAAGETESPAGDDGDEEPQGEEEAAEKVDAAEEAIAAEEADAAELETEDSDVKEELASKPEVSEAEEAEPEVLVAETEPVHEEREAKPKKDEPDSGAVADTVAVDRVERLRILGKRRPLNHPTWTAVDILINEPAFRDAQAHALSSLDREVAGVLVGPQPEKQPDGRYVVHISDTIIAKHTRMHGASVTYTPESWRYINDKMSELYPDETAVIVGWYHTHPGFGIFLSGMDKFIHQNFFTQTWHVAFVLDPLAHRSGFFCWDRGQTKVDPYEFPWPSWATGSW